MLTAHDPLCQQRVFRGHVARNSMREYILAMMRQLEEDEVFGKDAEAFELFLNDDLGMLVCTVQCARAYRPTHAHIYLIPYLYLPIAPCFYLPISRYSWLAPLLVRHQQLVAAKSLCPDTCCHCTSVQRRGTCTCLILDVSLPAVAVTASFLVAVFLFFSARASPMVSVYDLLRIVLCWPVLAFGWCLIGFFS